MRAGPHRSARCGGPRPEWRGRLHDLSLAARQVGLKVDDAIATAVDNGQVRRGGRFLWPAHGPSPLHPRRPTADSDSMRPASAVAADEAAAAVRWCLHAHGPQPVTAELADLVARGLRLLHDQGRVAEQGETGVWALALPAGEA